MEDKAKKAAMEKFLGAVCSVDAPEARERLPGFPPGNHIVELTETEYFQSPATPGHYYVKAVFSVLASTCIAPGQIYGYFSSAPVSNDTRARYTLQEMLKIGVASFGLATQDHEVMANAYEDRSGLLTKWCKNELITGNPIRIVATEKMSKNRGKHFVALTTIETAPDEKYWPGNV